VSIQSELLAFQGESAVEPDDTTPMDDSDVPAVATEADVEEDGEIEDAVPTPVHKLHVPPKIFKLIGKHHNVAQGHRGVDITIRRLRDAGFDWEDIRQHVTAFIKRCPMCQKSSERTVPVFTTPFTASHRDVLKHINVDAIGPLPISDMGFAHILVLIDTFSRWVEIIPIKSTSAKDAAKAIMQFLGRYGDLQTLLSDGGSQFVNGIIDEVVKTLARIEKEVTMAYSKEENTIVERANKEVMRHLRAIIFHLKVINEWEDYLPFVQRIMNSTVHASTGVAPYQLVMPGLSMDQRVLKPTELSESIDDYTRALLEKQNLIIEVARETQNQRDASNVKKRSLGKIPTEFPVNSFVMRSYPTTRMGKMPPTKFHLNKAGPFRVVNIDDTGSTYTLFNLTEGKEEKPCHVTRLSKYEHVEDGLNITPQQAALVDSMQFYVEAIRDYRGSFNAKNPKDRKQPKLAFLVKWQGYDESENTWEPWTGKDSNIRNNAVLHEWMRTFEGGKFAKHIPKHIVQVSKGSSDEDLLSFHEYVEAKKTKI